jgi:hypothetical protein
MNFNIISFINYRSFFMLKDKNSETEVNPAQWFPTTASHPASSRLRSGLGNPLVTWSRKDFAESTSPFSARILEASCKGKIKHVKKRCLF